MASNVGKSNFLQNEELKNVFNNSVVGLFETDIHGRFIFVNKRCCEITNYTEQEALDLNLLDLVDEEYKTNVASEWTKAKKENRDFKLDFGIKKSDGSLVWILGIIGAVFDSGKNSIKYSGGLFDYGSNQKIEGLDFSEYFKLLNRIKESERKLAEAQRLAKIGSWEWEIENDYVSWSDELYNIFQIVPGSEISLDTYFNTVHPEDRDLVVNTISDIQKTKNNFILEHRILLPNQEIKFLHCCGEVINDKNDQPFIIRGTAEDVTERQMSEEAILKRKLKTIEFQATLLELSKTPNLALNETFKRVTEADAKQIDTERVGIWLFNESRTAIRCMCLFKKSLNLHSNDLTLEAKKFPIYFNAVEENRAIIIYDTLKDVITSELIEIYMKPLGITSMLDIPIRSQGDLLGIVCHEHVGPKREWSMEEQTFASSVADIVALAIETNNRKIAEKELHLLNEKLAVLNEHKDKFISVISHDLKNPISSIISSSNLLIDHFDEFEREDSDRMLRIINKASKEIIYQLEELVRIAQLQNFTSLFYPEELSLYDEVYEDIKLVMQIAEQKKIRILNNISEEVYIDADKIMLKSILQNLLTNAIKFSYEGGEIEVNSEKYRHMVKITIRDHGKGMSKSKLKNLFSEKDLTSEKGTGGETGTGLGLKIVKDFIEKHNGEIMVESEEGRGTSISFTLPLAVKSK